MIDYISAQANCSQIVSDNIYNRLCRDGHYFYTDGNGEEFHRDIFCHKESNFKVIITEWFNTGLINVEIRGSLHKLCKNNNYSDFTLFEVKNTIKVLCDRLAIKPDKWHLHAFEFGVNVNYKSEIILKNLVNFNGYEVGTINYKSKGYLKRFQCSQFGLKIYHKSKQYGLKEDVLRYELKVEKMDYFGKSTHWTLQDLISEDALSKMREKLILSLDKLIVTQPITPNINREIKLYDFGRNPLNWILLKDTAPNKNTFSRKRRQFNAIIDNYTDVVSNFKNTVISKWDSLVLVANLPILEIHYPLHSYSHIIDYYSTKQCLVCGGDISMQHSQSLYCSEKLTGSRKCRDKAANFMKREKRLYPQSTLFDVGFGSLAYFFK
jgi:hypothetical protein